MTMSSGSEGPVPPHFDWTWPNAAYRQPAGVFDDAIMARIIDRLGGDLGAHVYRLWKERDRLLGTPDEVRDRLIGMLEAAEKELASLKLRVL